MPLPECGDQPSPTHCRASPGTHRILAAVPVVPCFQAAACSPQGLGTQPTGSPGEQRQADRGEWGSGQRGGMMPGSWRCAWAPCMVLGWCSGDGDLCQDWPAAGTVGRGRAACLGTAGAGLVSRGPVEHQGRGGEAGAWGGYWV